MRISDWSSDVCSSDLLHGSSDKFRTIVGPDVSWRAAGDEQVSQRRQHVLMLELTGNDQRQALPAGLVDDREDAELDRKSVVEGKSVSVRVDLGGRSVIKKKKKEKEEAAKVTNK